MLRRHQVRGEAEAAYHQVPADDHLTLDALRRALDGYSLPVDVLPRAGGRGRRFLCALLSCRHCSLPYDDFGLRTNYPTRAATSAHVGAPSHKLFFRNSSTYTTVWSNQGWKSQKGCGVSGMT